LPVSVPDERLPVMKTRVLSRVPMPILPNAAAVVVSFIFDAGFSSALGACR
jgi:hypothetical protein